MFINLFRQIVERISQIIRLQAYSMFAKAAHWPISPRSVVRIISHETNGGPRSSRCIFQISTSFPHPCCRPLQRGKNKGQQYSQRQNQLLTAVSVKSRFHFFFFFSMSRPKSGAGCHYRKALPRLARDLLLWPLHVEWQGVGQDSARCTTNDVRTLRSREQYNVRKLWPRRLASSTISPAARTWKISDVVVLAAGSE